MGIADPVRPKYCCKAESRLVRAVIMSMAGSASEGFSRRVSLVTREMRKYTKGVCLITIEAILIGVIVQLIRHFTHKAARSTKFTSLIQHVTGVVFLF